MTKSKFIILIFTSTILTGCSSFGPSFQEGWHFAKGDQYYRNGNNKEAEREFKAALDSGGVSWVHRAKSLIRLAQIYTEENRDSEADTSFKQAMELFDKNADDNHLKANFVKIKNFQMLAYEEYAKFCRKHSRIEDADKWEAKAKKIESSK